MQPSSVGKLVPIALCCALLNPGIPSASAIDFVHEVVPILKKHCAECHGGEEAEGGFSLNTKSLFLESDAASPGDAEGSYFLELIGSDDEEVQMPPPDKDRVSGEEREVLVRWVNESMPWESGFNFAGDRYEAPLQLREVTVPSINPELDERFPHPIDRFVVRHDLRQNRVPLSFDPADDAIYYRRASMDLVGLLPTPDQIVAFERSPSSNKHRDLVDSLLAKDIAYADHWMTFWNDWLRNDYTGTGFITKGRTQVTAWLYASLLDNKPLDAMVRELIAPPSQESAGFINGIKWRGTVSAGQTLPIQFAQSVGQTFLGINLKCASCHDSFIDKWRLKDSYGLAAIYANEPLEIHRCDKPTGETATASFLLPEIGQVDPDVGKALRLKQLAELMVHEKNGMLPRAIVNRLWAALMGRGIVEPLDAMNLPPVDPELLDYLAAELRDHDYDLKHVIRLIVTSQTYGAKSQANQGELHHHFTRMTAEQFLDGVWQITSSGPTKIDATLYGADLESRGDVMPRASLKKSDFLMRSLGRPQREQIVSTRPRDVTTLEAMNLANGEALAELLRQGAVNLAKEFQDQPTNELVEHLFLYAYARRPEAAEKELVIDAIGANMKPEGIADALWAMLMSPEFFFIR